MGTWIRCSKWPDDRKSGRVKNDAHPVAKGCQFAIFSAKPVRYLTDTKSGSVNAMDEDRIVDGILVVDDEDPGANVIFNFHTWVSIIEAIIVRYAGKTEAEAKALVRCSSLVENALNGYMAIVMRSHDLEYHWAMLLAHGPQYWIRGIDSNEPEGFWGWEKQYRKEHNLKDRSFVYSDELPE